MEHNRKTSDKFLQYATVIQTNVDLLVDKFSRVSDRLNRSINAGIAAAVDSWEDKNDRTKH